MSRAKFEAKYIYMNLAILDGDQYLDEFTQTKYEGWLAGRESMRDEAIDKLGEFEAVKCAQIVAGIEP